MLHSSEKQNCSLSIVLVSCNCLKSDLSLSLSQLLRHTSLFTFPGESEARFLLTVLLDAEDSRSHGTVVAVAGVVRYLQASATVVR